MSDPFLAHMRATLDQIRADGFYKSERVIESPQRRKSASPAARSHGCAQLLRQQLPRPGQRSATRARRPRTASTRGASAWRRCASSAARRACTSSSRRRCPRSCGTDDSILYSSCFDANGGLFETLLGEEDAIISDELNHASIIDGIRLCKAKRFRYRNNDMADLEAKLAEADAAGARFKMIATDGVFSMDGIIADLKAICDLADRYGALVMVDDSHAVGLRRRRTAAARPSSAASKAASTSSPARWARRWAARPAATRRAGAKSSSCCASARVRISSPTRWRRASPPPRSKCWSCCAATKARDCARSVRENGERFRRAMAALGFTLVPGSIRSFR